MAKSNTEDNNETASIEKASATSESSQESFTDVEIQGDYGSGRDHSFSDPKIADYWRNVYESAKYEGRHRYDPSFTWSASEEIRLKKRVDLCIMSWCWLMFLSLDLNRKSINQAISDDMLSELGMNTNDFNYGQTIFLVSFLAAELPSGLISKKLGPDVWIPTIITSWSIVSAAQAGLQNRTGYYVCRCLLGIFMGGFIPDTILYITYWYKSKELAIRLSWFYTVLSTSQIVGSLAGAGILQMRGRLGWSGWQWLFLIEGCITACVGILSWVLMPPGPCQTAGRLRGKSGWFTEHEEKILVNRILRDDPSKGDMHNRQGVNLERLWKTLKDYDLWPVYLLGITVYIPPNPPQNYLSFILRQLGFSTFDANLLTIPSQFMYGVNLLIITKVSEYFSERAIVSSISNIWIFPWLVALVSLGDKASPWLRYGLLTGVLSYPYCHAVLVAWNSRNSNAVRTRAVSAALYNMFVQAGNIIASNIYRDDDKPLYKRGNKILLAVCCCNIFLFYAVKYYYVARNRRREAAWAKLTGEERVEYIHSTKDEGAKRLDFRFAH
ncbi:MFS general substrate transporter [Marasmius fiardii PR-910]|nr:MFS general substrate transporter [Marasmius fiardii PR-910]